MTKSHHLSNGLLCLIVASILVIAGGCKKDDGKADNIAIEHKSENGKDSAEEQTMSELQKANCSDCNKTDSLGRKQGLWIKDDGFLRYEQYYKDGLRSGVFKQLNLRNGDLNILGEYTDGKESGIWYYYELGVIMMTFENHAANHDTITSEFDKKRYVPDYKCYYKGYYSNGNIEEEGWILWNEGDSFDDDVAKSYGKWKYYNEQGELIKIKEYKYDL